MSDGSWASADPIPDSIVVNTGDMLGIWTNQYYPATVSKDLLFVAGTSSIIKL